jgi:hypothetical protein
MNRADEIRDILKAHPEYCETLFCRGYIVTDRLLNLSAYPFYEQWKCLPLGSLNNSSTVKIYFHRWQTCHIIERNGITASIIGHAYNPFDMKHRETEILTDCIDAYKQGMKVFFDKVSELTGVHLIILNDTKRLIAVQDCTGIKACCYGRVNNHIYLTSHPQMVGDICNLQIDPFVRQLTDKWFFRFGQQFLPGNLTPYRELKRLGPNTYLDFSDRYQVYRFYPTGPHRELTPDEYDGILKLIRELMGRNIELCTHKWKRTAISLSGGIDSKTTLACANGLYDRLKYFSFHCKPAELTDAKAARRICEKIGVEHAIYPISGTNRQIKDYGVLKKIISHNISYIGVPPEHEIRKYIYLYRLNDFDVELKSWVSEIGRAIWGRKYGFEFPKVLTPRHFSIFQTRYIFAPLLLRESEGYYKEYLKQISLERPLYNYEHTDIYSWEFAFGAWGQRIFTSQEIFRHAVTIPINNRKLIDMFLWFPHECRKNDMVHRELIRCANRIIYDLNVSVHNADAGKKRIMLERTYYRYATLFYKKMGCGKEK